MNLLTRLKGGEARDITTLEDYMATLNSFTFGGLAYGYGGASMGVQQTLAGGATEMAPNNFVGLASHVYQASGVAFACMMVRQLVFSSVRFRWQTLRDGKPSLSFGTSDLQLLERPWVGGTTQDLLSKMLQCADLAGNAYVARFGDELVVMRPDWVDIALAERRLSDGRGQVGWEKVGYVYTEGGRQSGNDAVGLLADEVVHFCVDDQTEILTADGWKTVDTLREDDEALTLNHATGLTEWQPVIEVCEFPAQARAMLSMEGREHSSLTTLNHRWAVERKNSRAGRYERRWTTSENLSSGDRIPVAAYSADLPTQPKYTDALVELVSWFWTEGCIKRRKNGTHSRAVSISQSTVVNEGNVERIRAALWVVFGEPVADRTLPHQFPRWQELRSGKNAIFHLSSAAGDVLTQHAPGKVVTTDFLRALTQAQLDLFIKVSLLADNAGPNRLAQKSKAAAEQFALACVLAGHGVSIRQRRIDPKYGYGMWTVRILKNRHIYPQESRREKSTFRAQTVTHNGRVWCPRTPNQTWLARRNGAVYFTGNSPIPDPLSPYRGMSWLTPVLREIQADQAMTTHQRKFFDQGATPNMVIKHPEGATEDQVKRWDELFRDKHAGVRNAWKNLNLYPGADATPVGSNMREIDFKNVRGGGETRVAAAAGVPPVIVGLSEGLAAATYSNYGQARRRLADGTAHPLWQNLAGSMEQIIQRPRGSNVRLWYDTTDVPFLREDEKDAAEIQQIRAATINSLITSGYTPDSSAAAVESNDFGLLQHTGLTSVQLLPPGQEKMPATNGKPMAPATNGQGA